MAVRDYLGPQKPTGKNATQQAAKFDVDPPPVALARCPMNSPTCQKKQDEASIDLGLCGKFIKVCRVSSELTIAKHQTITGLWLLTSSSNPPTFQRTGEGPSLVGYIVLVWSPPFREKAGRFFRALCSIFWGARGLMSICRRVVFVLNPHYPKRTTLSQLPLGPILDVVRSWLNIR